VREGGPWCRAVERELCDETRREEGLDSRNHSMNSNSAVGGAFLS